MPVRALVSAAALFGITQNNVRVALARLLLRERLERNERGLYLLTPAARAIGGSVRAGTPTVARVPRTRSERSAPAWCR